MPQKINQYAEELKQMSVNTLYMRPITISATGIVQRYSGEQMKTLWIRNMIQLIQKVMMIDTCHKCLQIPAPSLIWQLQQIWILER
jgi:hypothetical protein